MGRACSTYLEKRNTYRTLAGKPEENRKVGRPRYRWRIILKWILEQ
jgi:hypothetical protein